MGDSKPCQTPIAVGTKFFLGDSGTYANPTHYKSIIGALQYLTMIRPDLSFVVNKLSQFLKGPMKLQW